MVNRRVSRMVKRCNILWRVLASRTLQVWILAVFTMMMLLTYRLDQAYNSVSFVSGITVCGEPADLSQPVLDRIKERAGCRLAYSGPKPKPASEVDDGQKAFELTHDLVGANGLGNFMFMTATTFGLAASSGRKPVFPEFHPHMSHFLHPFPLLPSKPPGGSLPKHRVDAAGIYEVTLPKKLATNLTATRVKPIISLNGFLQCWKYFHHIRDSIVHHFVFKPSVYHQVIRLLEEQMANYTIRTGRTPATIIGMHVRRGDLLQPIHHKYGHSVATARYLTRMTERFNREYPQSVIALVTNDFPFCRKIFGELDNILYMDGNNTAEVDMAMLTVMDSLILSVGTFGWWGAYLSEAKEVFYYKHWPRPLTPMSREYRARDFFFPTWTAAD